MDYILRRPFRDLASFLDDDDMPREGQDRAHNMLDDKGSESQFLLDLGNETDGLRQLVARESREDFVEKQDSRSRGDGPRQFELLAMLDRQFRRDRFGLAVHSDEREEPPGIVAGFSRFAMKRAIHCGH